MRNKFAIPGFKISSTLQRRRLVSSLFKGRLGGI
jgi:hypothetical protein